MSWVVVASPRLSIFEPLRREFDIGDYIKVLSPTQHLQDAAYRYPDDDYWHTEPRIGGTVWRITETDINSNPNRYRAQVVSPGSNGVFLEFNVDTLRYEKLNDYQLAIR